MRRKTSLLKRRSVLGFSLMELIAVVLIIGILVAMTTPLFFKTRLKGLAKVAGSILQSIRAAERAYLLTTGHYAPSPISGDLSTIAAINANLSTDFVDDGRWAYSISNTNNFTASAILDNAWWSDPINLSINAFNENVTCAGAGCPAAGF